MTVGSQPFPYGLGLRRNYNSRQSFLQSGLGFGWSHNYQIEAASGMDCFSTLGDAAAVFAVANIVAEYIIPNLFATPLTDSLVNVMTAAMVDRWRVDSVSDNSITVSSGTDTDRLVKLTSGTYAPVDARGTTVSINESSQFVYTTKDQQVLLLNSNGTLASWTWPNGVALTFSYSGTQLQSVTNGLGRTLTFSYSGSNLSSVSDGNGRTVSYTIDGSGDLTGFTDTLSNEITYSYASPGLLESVFLPQNPTSAVVTNTFDTLNRVKTQADAYSNTWTYYFSGYRNEENDPNSNARVWYYNNAGKAITLVDQLGNQTQNAYDGFFRLTQSTAPEGNAVEYGYDGNSNVLSVTGVAKPGSGLANIVNSFTFDATYNKVHTATDALSNVTTLNYDSATGNLLNVQRPEVGGETPEVQFTYNSRGQVLTATDETGIVTQFNYDSSTEKLLSVVVDYGTSPHFNLTTQFGYDTVGNTTSVTDPNDNETTFEFDTERKLTQRTDPTPLSYVTQFGYDDNGQRTSVQRQTGGTPAWQEYQYAYTLMGRLSSITDPLTYVTSYTFDNMNRLQKVTDAQSRVTQYAYTARSQVYTVTDPSNTVIDTRAYTDNGLVSTRTDARSHTTTWTPDGFDRLSQVEYADSTTEQLTYDANSNVLTRTTRGGNTITLTYDVLNRLSTKSPTGQGEVSYQYDLAGRLTEASQASDAGSPMQFSYDTAGRLSVETTPAIHGGSAATVTHDYDANSNETGLVFPDGYYISRFFDQLNRLTDIKLNGATAAALHFAYDQLSRRTSLTYANGVVTSYGYQLNNDLTSFSQAFTGGTTLSWAFAYNETHQMTSQTVSDSSLLWEPAASGTTTYGAANPVNEYPTVGGTSYSWNGDGSLTSDGSNTFSYNTEQELLSVTSTANPGGDLSATYDALGQLQQGPATGTLAQQWITSRGQRICALTSAGVTDRFVYGTGIDELLMHITVSGATNTNKYEQLDPLGSWLFETSDSSGAYVEDDNFIFDPYGVQQSTSTGTPPNPGAGYKGQWFAQLPSGAYVNYSRARWYNSPIGRFMQTDPAGYDKWLNLYSYCKNDPLNRVDPFGRSSLPGGVIPQFFVPFLATPAWALPGGGSIPWLGAGGAGALEAAAGAGAVEAGIGATAAGAGATALAPILVPLVIITAVGIGIAWATTTLVGAGGSDNGNGNGNGGQSSSGSGAQGGPPEGINIPGLDWPGSGYFGGGASPEGAPPGGSIPEGDAPGRGPSVPEDSGPYVPKPAEMPGSDEGLGNKGPNFG